MRRLIVCADGTWNRPEEGEHVAATSTNVEKIQHAIKAVAGSGRNATSQITFYHKGVGTGDFIDKILGGAFGEGIDRNIMECYQFLVNNYSPGDEIYLFGFSRGAYTARSLAGMIRNSGLLRQENVSMTQEAYSLYRDRNPAKHPESSPAKTFRQQFSHPDYDSNGKVRKDDDGVPVDSTTITCIGVWDTVGALGIPIGLFDRLNAQRFAFHDTTLSSRVKFAFHALAIDERRKPFAPTLWEQSIEDAANKRNWLEQAWFTGVHSNIGGGYPDSSLSDLALLWMVERIEKHGLGLEFDRAFLAQMTRPNALGRLEDSMSPFFEGLGPILRKLSEIQVRKESQSLTWEYVHESALKRFTQTQKTPLEWNPDNYRDYASLGERALFEPELPSPFVEQTIQQILDMRQAGNTNQPVA